MPVISGGVVATAANVVGTMMLLNAVGATLALFPRRGPGRERGLLSQSAIQVWRVLWTGVGWW